eukprot:scaffold598_cov183-Ochromonas_danica.AAC.2
MEITTSIEQQQQKQKPQRRSSSSEGNKTISNSNSTPALLLNNHNHRAVSEKRSGGQTLLLASTVAGGTRTIRSATPSRPGRQRLFTTQSADANNETFQDFHRIAAGGGSNNRSNTSSSSSQQPSSSMEFDLEVLGSEGNGNGTTATTRPLDGQHPDILDSIVLYTAIAYLLWDMDHISIAKVYATAALRLCPSYGPAARCIATLLFFEGERRLCFRYINVALDHLCYDESYTISI